MSKQQKRRIKVRMADGRNKTDSGAPLKRSFTKKLLIKTLKDAGVVLYLEEAEKIWRGRWRNVTITLPKSRGGKLA